MFVSLSGVEKGPPECVSSGNGPHKENETTPFLFGTTEFDTIPYREFPFKDTAHIAATFTPVPKGEWETHPLPQKQEWSVVLGMCM